MRFDSCAPTGELGDEPYELSKLLCKARESRALSSMSRLKLTLLSMAVVQEALELDDESMLGFELDECLVSSSLLIMSSNLKASSF